MSSVARAAAFVVLTAACGGGGGDFCSLAADFEAADLGTGDLGRSALEADVAAALDHLDRLVEAAPDDLVADVVRFRDGFEAFARGTETLGPDFAAAAQRIDAHLDSACGTAS